MPEIDWTFWSTVYDSEFFWPMMIFLTSLVLLLVIFYTLRAIARSVHNKNQIFNTVLMLVMLPQMSASQKAGQSSESDISLQQLQEKISVMENFLTTLAALKAERGFKAWWRGRTDNLSVEIVAHQGKISFYISSPKKLVGLIKDQITAQFPDAVVQESADYNIFAPDSIIGARTLEFKKDFFFPIKTYKKIETDPMKAIINSLSQVDEQDGAAIQIVFRSAKKEWHKPGAKVAAKMQQGFTFEGAMKEINKSPLSALSKEFKNFFKSSGSGQGGQPEQKEHHQLSPMEQEIVKGLEEKTSKAGVDANIRIVVASKLQAKVDMYLDNIFNAFAQYNIYEYGNSFSPADKKNKVIIRQFIYRNIDEKIKIVLNSEELASLFHFPLSGINSNPKIHWLEARQAPPPLELPQEGAIMGESHYRGMKRIVRITDEDRRRHIYSIGKTGTGKSYLMANMILQDIQNGKGVCVMDPHGELAQEIIKYIPKERAEDVIYFNPADIDRPLGMNLLEFERPEQKTFVINELLNIFDKLYDLRSTGGPMFEQYFRNAAQLVMEDQDSGMTLMEIPRVLADDEYRAYKLSKTKNPTVKDFWEKEAQKAGGEASLANMVPYITSKLTQFIGNDYMRPIIAQQKSAFSFRKAMDEGKILLCDLAKGKIGDMNSDLLGMVIIGKLLGAALSRADMAPEDRKDFYLYIDEFQNYLTEGISIILSEARKYRLSLYIAHQFLGQLAKTKQDEEIRDAIFGNIGTIMCYRVGVDDAEVMAKQFAPVFSEYDVMNVPSRTVFIKLLVNNQNPPAFNMFVPQREKPKNPEIAEAIMELSRLKYGRDRDIIESEILERARVRYN